MIRQHSPLKILSLIVASLVMGLSCGEEKLTGPVDRSIDIAGKPSAGGGLTVTAAVPNTAPQDTTLDVTVSGTGFDRGSRIDLELDGVVSPKVRTNSTRFVNKTTLVANITIAADADPDLYDVAVTTTRGKRGIGIELFEVSYAMTSLGTLPGHDQSEAVAISESGDITGGSGRSQPWDEGIFFLSDGVMQEAGTGYAIAASDNQRIVGNDPPSVWERLGGGWVNTPLPLLPGMIHQAQNIAPDGTAIVGASGGKSLLWRESGGTWTIEILPASCPCDINAAGMIVGHDR
ncbi:MAG TPA: hypothetical protein VEY33_03185, partial [Gemmatimonadota bacterium]|nr:hypothetical protein [Gemmatimonadota bacterium]